MPGPSQSVPVEVEFKALRRAAFLNRQQYPLKIGDPVIVQVDRGIDLGRVHRQDFAICNKQKSTLGSILRKAQTRDLEKHSQHRTREKQAVATCRERVVRHKLTMKVIDGEAQFDSKKLTFYFTAEKRVNFRELVKDLASEFRTRIELRQIGAREEAKRVGGCGVCGIEKCCTTFITKFQPVTTEVAKDQNLPINPARLTGACGKLKCCLVYERDMYLEAIKNFPSVRTRVTTARGVGRVARIDVYQETLVLQHEDATEETITLMEVLQLLETRN